MEDLVSMHLARVALIRVALNEVGLYYGGEGTAGNPNR